MSPGLGKEKQMRNYILHIVAKALRVSIKINGDPYGRRALSQSVAPGNSLYAAQVGPGSIVETNSPSF